MSPQSLRSTTGCAGAGPDSWRRRAPLSREPDAAYEDALAYAQWAGKELFDAETARVSALSNRVPTAVLILEIIGSAVALGLLAAYLVLASVLVALLLLVTTDLDQHGRADLVDDHESRV
jgi:hypothetical protein